jgi:hypothetical protein
VERRIIHKESALVRVACQEKAKPLRRAFTNIHQNENKERKKERKKETDSVVRHEYSLNVLYYRAVGISNTIFSLDKNNQAASMAKQQLFPQPNS